MLTVLPVSAQAQDRAELVAERIQSNLPLYTFDWKDIWPRGFHSGDEFGCTSRVAFGDWRFIPADTQASEESWQRYTNYGAFHCAAVMYTAEERAKLDEAAALG